MPDDRVKSVTIPYRDLVIRADPDYERDRTNEREYIMSSGRVFSGNPRKRGAYKAGDAVYAFQLMDFATAEDFVNEVTFGIANGTRNEINATTDAFAAVLQAFGSRNETAISNDFPTSTSTVLNAAESVLISDLLTSAATMALVRAESVVTADTFTVRKLFIESRTESAATTDTPADNTSSTFDPTSINATNTGAILGGTFTTNAATSISTPGTYTNQRFTSLLNITPSLANKDAAFLFSNCIFEGTNNGPNGTQVQLSYINGTVIPSNIKFEFCTFDDKGTGTVNGIAGPFTSLTRCWFKGFNNCVNVWEACTIDKCGNDGLMLENAAGDAHYDCIENNGTAGMTLINSRFINNHGQTSAVMLNNEFGPLNNILVNNNYLEGGGYTCYCDNSFSTTNTVTPGTIVFTNNIIKTGQFGYGAFFTSGVTFGAGNTFIGAGGTTTITHGSQLIAQGSPGANVGPTAILPGGASGYPGNLKVVALPSRGFFRADTPSEFAVSGTYVYNNLLTNKGGIVPAGGMLIDGYQIPAGTQVVQFTDLSGGGLGTMGIEGGVPNLLFRGCRMRYASGAPGFFNTESAFSNKVFIFFCDLGSPINTDANSGYNCVAIKIFNGAGFIAYRNYITHTTTGIQNNVNNGEITENWIGNLSKQLNPTDDHLNGITVNGGNINGLILRNHIVIQTPDGQGQPIGDTDCISYFQDFGSFPGTGTNRDGSRGYLTKDNYVGGTGYCFYSGMNAGKPTNSVNNMVVTGNRITTQYYPSGGINGVEGAPPVWGSFGNVTSDNRWADGPNAGQIAF